MIFGTLPARDPLLRDRFAHIAGILSCSLAVWWIVPAFTGAGGSIIKRILALSIPIEAIQIAVLAVAALTLAGALVRNRLLAMTAASVGFAWWTFIWITAFTQQPLSTSTGSYGIIVYLAGTHLKSVLDDRPTA